MINQMKRKKASEKLYFEKGFFVVSGKKAKIKIAFIKIMIKSIEIFQNLGL
jgi:hypothetical protein